jgi:hypothetical protein
MNNYIEKNKQYWGQEFANLINVQHRAEHDEIAAMGCYTLMYHIADNFQNGKYRTEILKFCGVEK